MNPIWPKIKHHLFVLPWCYHLLYYFMTKKIKICAHCGGTDVIGGRDHVPPRAIFGKPRPQNLITVPACFKCNNGNSKDDETFKTFLAFILGQSPATDSLYKSAISTAQKKFSRYILANLKRAYLTTPSGIIYEQGYAFPLGIKIAASLEGVIKRITTGLYYHHFGCYIGHNATFQVRFHNILKKEMIELIKYSVDRIGTGQFSYGYAKGIEGGKCMSLWLFEFYERYWVSCGTLVNNEPSPNAGEDRRTLEQIHL